MDDMRKKRCIAMLLAGGQGSRLGLLTKVVAKPAVPFGGKYRIIDFPLSNCANSGIDVVGVLTQYQPLELNRYIGSGQPWGLDLLDGGVFVLPPYMKAKSGEWYRGTANAIYQNVSFIEQYDPDYVLILSGDHIYKMDYNKMLAAHIESERGHHHRRSPRAVGSGALVRHHERGRGKHHPRIRGKAQEPQEQPGQHGRIHLHLVGAQAVS